MPRFTLPVVLAAAFAVGCAPPPVEPRARPVSPPSIQALIADLPGASPSGSAGALEARLRRLTDHCSSAHVARVSATEVRADAGTGCPGARGALSASFDYEHGGVAVTIHFQDWSLADGDVLDGDWQGHAADQLASFSVEELPFAQRAHVNPPAVDPALVVNAAAVPSTAERCLEGLGTGAVASGKLLAAGPLVLLAWPLLLAPPLIGLMAGCK